MEVRSYRNIKSGREYDHLFPRPEGNDITIKGSAGVSDTLTLIRKTVPQTLKDTEKIAQVLKGRNLYETCSNIWHFVYQHIRYKKDKDGTEQVRRPARAWADRESGVDCDCYTEFISSILTNLNIPHKNRIAIYNWDRGYQHIYPIVPKDGKLNYELDEREDYIVLDCVKNDFDDEEPYLKFKDDTMKLDYLNGIDDDESSGYQVPQNADARDLADLYGEDEMGELGNWLTKAKDTVKTTVKKVAAEVKKDVKHVAQEAKKVVVQVGKNTQNIIHTVNRYVNPATVLLRNGFLLSMRMNISNVAGKLRYAYVTDSQAKAMKMNMDALQKLRAVKDKAETIYWQAGGLKENLKKGILNGRGNKDHKVPLSGLDGLGEVYADMLEYDILNKPLEGLGMVDPAEVTAMVNAASSILSSLVKAIAQIKGIFSKGTVDEKEFESDVPKDGTGNANDYYDPKAEEYAEGDKSNPLTLPPGGFTPDSLVTPPNGPVFNPGQNTPVPTFTPPGNMPASYSPPPAPMPAPLPATIPQDASAVVAPEGEPKEGFFNKAGDWIKKNPVPVIAIVAGAAGAGYLIYKNSRKKKRGSGLNGLPKRKKKANKQNASNGKTKKDGKKIRSIKF